LFALDPLAVGSIIVVFAPMMLILRNFTLSGMLAYSSGPLVAFLCGLDKVEVAAMSFVAILVLLSHRKNIRQEIARMAGAGVKAAPVQMHKGPHDEV